MIVGIDTTFLVQHDVKDTPHHEWARRFLLEEVFGRGDTISLSPQVLSEYIHVVTDGRRFERPLPMMEAVERASTWWYLKEARRLFPSENTIFLFLEWVERYHLGRKRVLDTLLAATYMSHEVSCVLSTDVEGFSIFSELNVIHP